jgi:regulator of sigma E protease
MLDIGLSLIAFIVAIGLLVSVHEFGHFWVARKLGFKVQRFSIGFGKPIARWRGRDPDRTEYWISSLPLGGYVKMLDEREGDVPPAERHRAFNNRPPPQRIAVLLAGPGFNFLFAIAAYWLLFVTGVPGVKPYIGEVSTGSIAESAGLRAGDVIESIDGEPTETWEHATLAILDGLLDDSALQLRVRGADGAVRDVQLDVRGRVSELTEPDALFPGLGIRPGPVVPMPAVVGGVVPGSPAEQAGLEPGDWIVSIDGIPVETFEQWAELIRERPGERVELRVARDVPAGLRPDPAQTTTLIVQVGEVEADGQRIGQIGVSSLTRLPAELLPPETMSLIESLRAEQRYGVVDSIGRAFGKTWEMSALTVRMLGRMVVGDVSMRNISGPIAIAGYAGESAQAGLSAFLSFLAIVSISLGILNLLPVPILDGGQIVYQVAEWIKGTPLSERAMALGQQLGILLMILLMGFVFYNDLSRVFS